MLHFKFLALKTARLATASFKVITVLVTAGYNGVAWKKRRGLERWAYLGRLQRQAYHGGLATAEA
jgi:hypothetical protein